MILRQAQDFALRQAQHSALRQAQGAAWRVAITLGDPGGIGPEVTLKALARLTPFERKNIVLLGPETIYSQLLRKLSVKIPLVYFFDRAYSKKVVLGRSVDAQTRLAVASIDLAASLAMQGKVEAIVTAPINKAGLKKAGFMMPGHTEYLAELSGTKKYEMMLVGGPLRTVLVTRHVAIKDVPSKILKNRVEETILMADFELRRSFGIQRPRLVVCGLNPHAGEKGNFGREEIEQIRPAVISAKKKIKGVVTGPLSPDALFYDAYQGKYDAQICMYHDQGLIPLKMISRGHGVNVTLGLPFVRTSPDHGTAYDIASSFKADPGSMLEAIRLAIQISAHRKRHART